MGSYTDWLRTRDDDELAGLLVRRPYLATPTPGSFASLAGRATSRSATQRALATVDALGLQVLRATLVLGQATRAQTTAAVLGPDPDPDDALRVAGAVADLLATGLVWDDDEALRPAPGVAALLDPDGHQVSTQPGDRPRDRGTESGPPSDGRLFRTVARPPQPVPTAVPADTVAAESVRAAQALVAAVERLVEAWADPPPVLRRGGLGTRDLRRTAHALGTSPTEAAFVVELAASASLVVADLTGPTGRFVPTTTADTWESTALPDRWAVLARAWVTSARTAWLVGTKDDRDTVRTAGHPDGWRPWLPRLKRSVLTVLAEVEADAAGAAGALTAEQVHDVLAWRTPLAVPPLDVVAPLLTEAARLGVTGAGALSPAGRTLLTGGSSQEQVAARLDADLPPPVDEVWLQADLTGIVPGRPSDRLARLLRSAAREESSGGALTVRFTPESVAAAVASSGADVVLAELTEVSRGPVPQGLEYLVRDAARRHDALRTGPASAYLRSADEALLTRVVADPTLAGCGLVQIAPTVVVAQVPPAQLADDLKKAGLAVRAETPDGQVVTLQARRRARPRPSVPFREPTLADVRAAVTRLRDDQPDPPPDAPPATDDLASSPPRRPAGHGEPTRTAAQDPLDTLMVLREAVDGHTESWVDLVDDTGRTTRHRLRPVAVDGGRLRAVDPSRAVELTVAVHRIAAAAPVAPSPGE